MKPFLRKMRQVAQEFANWLWGKFFPPVVKPWCAIFYFVAQEVSIKIVDAATDEVIREIPPEQVQRIAEDLQSPGRRASIGKRPAGADRTAGGGVDRYV